MSSIIYTKFKVFYVYEKVKENPLVFISMVCITTSRNFFTL